MPRKGTIKVRQTEPDLVYKNKLVTKLINRCMRGGKKSVAQDHVYQALGLIAEKLKKNELEVLLAALENIKPRMEVRSRRVGGAAYQVPMPVSQRRQFSLAIRWLVTSAQKRPNTDYHTFADKLAAEVLDAYNTQGGAVKKKEDTHRMAEANKAFSHFRW